MKTLLLTIAILIGFASPALAENVCGNEDPLERATTQTRMDDLCDEEGSSALWDRLQEAHKGESCSEVVVCTKGRVRGGTMYTLHVFETDCSWESNSCTILDND